MGPRKLHFHGDLRAGSAKWLVNYTEGGEARVKEASGARACYDALRNGCGDVNLQMVSILGPAREGKSTLMNALTGGVAEHFAVGHEVDPCTAGVDLELAMLPPSCMDVEDVSLVDEAKTSAPSAESNASYRVALVDVEGQGDKEENLDVCLALPILLTSKVVLFNWRGGFQKEKILTSLALLRTAAHRVATDMDSDEDSDSDDDSNSNRRFGHLIVVLRDYSCDSTVKKVERKLFRDERGTNKGEESRNAIRKNLRDEFESLSVQVIPPPPQDVDDLVAFMAKAPAVAQLRAKISQQLASGPKLFNGEAITGTTAAALVPALVAAVNSSKIVSLKAAWVVVEEAMAARVLEDLREQLQSRVDQKRTLHCVEGKNWMPPMALEELKADAREWSACALGRFDPRNTGSTASSQSSPAVPAARLSVLSEARLFAVRKQLDDTCTAVVTAAVSSNNKAVEAWSNAMCEAIFTATEMESTLEATLEAMEVATPHMGDLPADCAERIIAAGNAALASVATTMAAQTFTLASKKAKNGFRDLVEANPACVLAEDVARVRDEAHQAAMDKWRQWVTRVPKEHVDHVTSAAMGGNEATEGDKAASDEGSPESMEAKVRVHVSTALAWVAGTDLVPSVRAQLHEKLANILAVCSKAATDVPEHETSWSGQLSTFDNIRHTIHGGIATALSGTEASAVTEKLTKELNDTVSTASEAWRSFAVSSATARSTAAMDKLWGNVGAKGADDATMVRIKLAGEAAVADTTRKLLQEDSDGQSQVMSRATLCAQSHFRQLEAENYHRMAAERARATEAAGREQAEEYARQAKQLAEQAQAELQQASQQAKQAEEAARRSHERLREEIKEQREAVAAAKRQAKEAQEAAAKADTQRPVAPSTDLASLLALLKVLDASPSSGARAPPAVMNHGYGGGSGYGAGGFTGSPHAGRFTGSPHAGSPYAGSRPPAASTRSSAPAGRIWVKGCEYVNSNGTKVTRRAHWRTKR